MQNIPPRRYFEWTQSSPTVTVQTCSLFDVHAMIKLQFETVVKSKSMRRKKTCRSFENEGGSGRVQQVLRSWNCLQRKYRRWAFFLEKMKPLSSFLCFFSSPGRCWQSEGTQKVIEFWRQLRLLKTLLWPNWQIVNIAPLKIEYIQKHHILQSLNQRLKGFNFSTKFVEKELNLYCC